MKSELGIVTATVCCSGIQFKEQIICSGKISIVRERICIRTIVGIIIPVTRSDLCFVHIKCSNQRSGCKRFTTIDFYRHSRCAGIVRMCNRNCAQVIQRNVGISQDMTACRATHTRNFIGRRCLQLVVRNSYRQRTVDIGIKTFGNGLLFHFFRSDASKINIVDVTAASLASGIDSDRHIHTVQTNQRRSRRGGQHIRRIFLESRPIAVITRRFFCGQRYDLTNFIHTIQIKVERNRSTRIGQLHGNALKPGSVYLTQTNDMAVFGIIQNFLARRIRISRYLSIGSRQFRDVIFRFDTNRCCPGGCVVRLCRPCHRQRGHDHRRAQGGA